MLRRRDTACNGARARINALGRRLPRCAHPQSARGGLGRGPWLLEGLHGAEATMRLADTKRQRSLFSSVEKPFDWQLKDTCRL